MSKGLTIAVMLLLAFSSVMIVEIASAAIPKPSVPEFTVKLIDSSYDIPPTTATDPFTGQIITHAGSHVEARTLEIRINNEPFTPFSVTEGSANWTAYFMYNIRWKGHYEQDWHEIYSPSNGFLPRAESSETVYSNQGEYSSTDGLKLTAQGVYIILPPDGKVDFQVKALIGYVHRVVEGGMAPWYFFGEESGWSNTQTLTINEGAPSSNPTASPSSSSTTNQHDTQTGSIFVLQVALVVLALAVAGLLAVVVVLWRKVASK
jgi:hypothetical protein